jgi:hypothetical protein
MAISFFGSTLEGRRKKDHPKSVQSTTRNRYALIERTKKMSHDRLADHIMGCCDDDCEICDMGQSGEMIDDDDEGSGSVDNYGDRSFKDRRGSGSQVDNEGSSVSPRGTDASARVKDKSEAEFGEGGSANLVNVGDKTYKKNEHADKTNLMRHGEHLEHSAKHPGFRAVASKIASKQGISSEAAKRILAFRSRNASAGAKKSNPRLARVKG